MKANLANLLPISEPTVVASADLMKEILDRVTACCPKVEGEELRPRYYDRDAGIEFRTQAYTFDLTIGSEFRYGGRDEGRLPNGDVALRCPLKVSVNWSGCGSRSAVEAVTFAGRLMTVVTVAQAAVDAVVAGRTVVQVFETADQERRRAESVAMAAIVREIAAENGAALAARKPVRAVISNEQFMYEDEGRTWTFQVVIPAKNRKGERNVPVAVTVKESGIANVVLEIVRAD